MDSTTDTKISSSLELDMMQLKVIQAAVAVEVATFQKDDLNAAAEWNAVMEGSENFSEEELFVEFLKHREKKSALKARADALLKKITGYRNTFIIESVQNLDPKIRRNVDEWLKELLSECENGEALDDGSSKEDSDALKNVKEKVTRMQKRLAREAPPDKVEEVRKAIWNLGVKEGLFEDEPSAEGDGSTTISGTNQSDEILDPAKDATHDEENGGMEDVASGAEA